MADIDMIPRSYRDAVRLRRVARLTVAALAVVVVVTGAGNALLRWRSAGIERQVAALRSAAAQAQSASARDASMRDEQARAAQAGALLRTLRRQGELAAFAQALDEALPPAAWLTGVNVRRGLQTVPGAAAEPAIATTVELAGQAASYDAITAFLAGLGRSKAVATVQLQSSAADATANAIAFHAVVQLTWQAPQ